VRIQDETEMSMAKWVKRRAPCRPNKLFYEARGRPGGTITGERNLRDQQLFLIPPFRSSGLGKYRLLTLGFLFFLSTAKKLRYDSWPVPVRSPFLPLPRPVRPLTFWSLVADVLDIAVVS